MVVVHEAGPYAMEAADWSRTRGIIEMPTTIPASWPKTVSDPPRLGESRQRRKPVMDVRNGLLVFWLEGL